PTSDRREFSAHKVRFSSERAVQKSESPYIVSYNDFDIAVSTQCGLIRLNDRVFFRLCLSSKNGILITLFAALCGSCIPPVHCNRGIPTNFTARSTRRPFERDSRSRCSHSRIFRRAVSARALQSKAPTRFSIVAG